MPLQDGKDVVVFINELDECEVSKEEGNNNGDLEWIYKFQISVIMYQDETKRRTELDNNFETYRKAIAKKYAYSTSITINDNIMYIVGISGFCRDLQDKYYVIKINLEYKHIEAY